MIFRTQQNQTQSQNPVQNQTIYNQVTLQGRLGKDPNIKYFQSGAMLAEFSIALYQGKNEDDTYKPSTWIDCKAWKDAAEVLNHCTKGDEVAIEGKLAHDEWVDRETGKTRKKVYVLAFKARRIERRNTPATQSDEAFEEF